MLNNIFIIQNTDIGGHLALSVFLTNLLKAYKKDKNTTYSLICGSIEDEGNLGDMRRNIEIYTTDTGLYSIKDNIVFSWRTFHILRKTHKNNPVDIIHALYPNSSLLGAILFKVFCSWKTRIIYDVRSPWIEMSFANNHLSNKKTIIKTIMHISEYILIRFVSEFVFITQGTYEYYREKYNLKNIQYTIIPSGVSVKEFQIPLSEKRKTEILHEYNAKNNDIIIGYVGTISKMRELDGFIEDNAKIIKDSNYKIIFIGDGDGVESLEASIDKNSLRGKVHLLGRKSRTQIPEYIQSFDYGLCHLPDIFVFRNSFPLKVLEYLSAGKKVLCSNVKIHKGLQKVFKDEIIIYRKTVDIEDLENKSIIINEIINEYDWSKLYKKYKHTYARN